jgi:hypothetical protein
MRVRGGGDGAERGQGPLRLGRERAAGGCGARGCGERGEGRR